MAKSAPKPASSPPSLPPPTAEQQAILDALKSPDNIMVRALAGCAKTTTLEMVARALPMTPTLALAFNVKIKNELEKRLPEHFAVKTFNGLGHSAWAKAIGRRPGLDENKLGRIITATAKAQRMELSSDDWVATRRLVVAAMQAGLAPKALPGQGLIEDTPSVWQDLADIDGIPASDAVFDLAYKVLTASIKESFAGTISFDDQIYMSVVFGGVFPRFPIVLVDEAQDLSPLNHQQVKRCSAGKLIVVGDPNQAIYAFRGADFRSMDKLRDLRPNWIELPLNLTFRCPRRVVEAQHWHVPEFRAAEANVTGEIITLPSGSDETWSWNDIQNFQAPGSIAIICRNNAPIVGMAFKLIRKGVGVHVIGRDIGKSLLKFSKIICPDDSTPASVCLIAINNWKLTETSKAVANNKEYLCDGIEDRAESLLAVLASGEVKTAGELRSEIARIFAKDSAPVTLSTGHKAKGLEWDNVIHLDPFRIPSKFARKLAATGNNGPLIQENNLQYVIETRTKNVLFRAKLEDFE